MKIFYIDYENVDGSLAFLHPDPEDEAVLFHSTPSRGKLAKHMDEWIGIGCAMRFIQCEVGTKNALDFVLVSEMASRICTGCRETAHVIVSGDHGYDAAVKYWRGKAVDVRRIEPSAAERADAGTEDVNPALAGSPIPEAIQYVQQVPQYVPLAPAGTPYATDPNVAYGHPAPGVPMATAHAQPVPETKNGGKAGPSLYNEALLLTGDPKDAEMVVAAMQRVAYRRRHGNWLSGPNGAATMLNNALHGIASSASRPDINQLRRVYAALKPYAGELIERYAV